MKSPTAQELFGASPWITDAGGVGPTGPYAYNPIYFATPETAATLAKMLGGTVVQVDAITPAGLFKQNQPNQMIQIASKGSALSDLLYAGMLADYFNHDFALEDIEAGISGEIGSKWTFVAPVAPGGPVKVPLKPSIGLMVAKVGGVAMQADGTTWERKS